MTNWDLIGGNPAPGRPTEIRQLARRLDFAATEADAATSALEDIGLDLPESGWQGKTAEAFIDVFGELAPELRKLVHAYEGVGGALSRYADRVEDLQQSAMQAAARATEAEAARRTSESAVAAATSALRSYRSQYEAATRRADQARDQAVELSASGNPAAEVAWDHYHDVRQDAGRLGDQVHQATGQISAAESAVDQAGRTLRRSCDDADDIADAFRRAAATAGREIQDALPDGWANRSNLEKVLSTAGDVLGGVGELVTFLNPVAFGLTLVEELVAHGGDLGAALDSMANSLLDAVHVVRRALDYIDDALGLLTTIFTVGAFFFPVLAPVAAGLALASLVVAATKLTLTATALGLYAATGRTDREVGWGELFWDSVGVAVAVVGYKGATKLKGMESRGFRQGAANWRQSLVEPYKRQYGVAKEIWNASDNLHPLGRTGDTVTTFLFRETPRVFSGGAGPTAIRIFDGIGQVKGDIDLLITPVTAVPTVLDLWEGVDLAPPRRTTDAAGDYLQHAALQQQSGNGTLVCVPVAPVTVLP